MIIARLLLLPLLLSGCLYVIEEENPKISPRFGIEYECSFKCPNDSGGFDTWDEVVCELPGSAQALADYLNRELMEMCWVDCYPATNLCTVDDGNE